MVEVRSKDGSAFTMNNIGHFPFSASLTENHQTIFMPTVVAGEFPEWFPSNENIIGGSEEENASGSNLVSSNHGPLEFSLPVNTQLESEPMGVFVQSMTISRELQVNHQINQNLVQDVESSEQAPSEASAERMARRNRTGKRQLLDPGKIEQRAKRRQQSSPLPGYNAISLEFHVTHEKERYENLGTPCPQQVLSSSLTESPIPSWAVDYQVEVGTFFYAMGSSNSLALFQEILQAYRHNASGQWREARRNLSNAERVTAIESLDKEISYLGFVRRCHTYQLSQDSNTSSQQIKDNFVIQTTRSIAARKTSKRGNPFHIATAQVTTSMMEEVFPNLKKGDAKYNKMYRLISSLRQLGQRLALLVDRFGFGVLGLIPLTSRSSTADIFLSIDDNMYFFHFSSFGSADQNRILSLPEDTFRKIILFLDQHMGNLLRQVSDTIKDIVAGMFHQTLDQSRKFPIESIARSEITKHPRISEELCSLISGPSSAASPK